MMGTANAKEQTHENVSGLAAGESDKASPTNQRQRIIKAPFSLGGEHHEGI